ncbi:MAG: AI-2E family transporter, partial [Candidatus Cloacimonetes bacterium]|nr:AI-2E family transporter [Candidatus Cloacimonadota bacterium]
YLFLTLIFMIFIITGGVKFEKRMKKALGESGKIKAFATLLNIQIQIQRYFVNKSIISAGTSLCGMLILAILQVDFIIISGTLLFALNFIPNIGSVIASLFPILICLIDFGFGWRVILVAILMILNQVLFANIIEPKFMGERLNLSPLVILIALVFWGWVWGIIGMMIAVPLTSAINIVLKQVDKDNIVSAIISDE